MNTTQAASLPILTNSEAWPLTALGLGEPMRFRMKGDRGSAQSNALSADGRPTLASGCIPQLLDKEGRLRPQKGHSLHVINAVPDDVIEAGDQVRAEGLIWVQPYESNGRVLLSITVESLVPVTVSVAKKAEG
ncbi:hypothetical protein GCM10027421_16190 [Microbacterium shaanxiense]